MERRDFIKKSAIGSTCAIAGTLIASNAKAAENKTGYTCKITVLKKTINTDWNKEYRI